MLFAEVPGAGIYLYQDIVSRLQPWQNLRSAKETIKLKSSTGTEASTL